jgi:hypothetical protein
MSTKRVKVEWFKHPGALDEAYQQIGMLFAFATDIDKDEVHQVCHEWVKCRDYLHDAVRTQITGKPSSIYGFNFNINNNPNIDLKKTRMLVTKGDMKDAEVGEFKDKMKSALKLLRHFEKRVGISLSKMAEVDTEGSGKKFIAMFSSSPAWLKSPHLVSMYTFLIRLGDKRIEFKDAKSLREGFRKLYELHKSGKLDDNDAKYLGKMHNKLHTIMDKRNSMFIKKEGYHKIYFDDILIRDFHNYGGILSLCDGVTPDKELNEIIKKEWKNV